MRFVLVLAALGCGGEDAVWDELDADGRSAYMTDTVLPETKAEFEAYDARFADMGCTTCHQADTFAIPNPDLPALDPNAPATGAGADFMADTVVPMMNELLGTDDVTCTTCHPSQ